MPNRRHSEEHPRLLVEWEVEDSIESSIDRALLEAVLLEAFSDRLAGKGLQIGLTITTDEGIQELNRQYRGKDAPTDVLSFPLLEFERPEEPRAAFPVPPGEPMALGDIVVSYPRAVEQAQAYGHSLEREIAFLLVHGAMHLLGYDHEDPSDQPAMRREEEAVLGRLNRSR
jgi:probable rRNA maturation factor